MKDLVLHHTSLPLDPSIPLSDILWVCPICQGLILQLGYLVSYTIPSNWWLHEADTASACTYLRSLVSGARP